MTVGASPEPLIVDDKSWVELLTGATGDRASRPRRICELCVDMLAVTGAGISMVSDIGNHGFVCATDGTSARIEDLQITLGEGPCVDAVGSGAPVLVPDLSDSDGLARDRWPAFLESAAGFGVQAVFAFPLRVGAINVGALDLYRTGPGGLDDSQLTAALQAADAAAVALLDLDLGLGDGAGANLDPVTAHQFQVHQATGMVQAQTGSTIEQAFLLLRAHAFSTARPLIDVAVDVVERRLRFSSEES